MCNLAHELLHKWLTNLIGNKIIFGFDQEKEIEGNVFSLDPKDQLKYLNNLTKSKNINLPFFSSSVTEGLSIFFEYVNLQLQLNRNPLLEKLPDGLDVMEKSEDALWNLENKRIELKSYLRDHSEEEIRIFIRNKNNYSFGSELVSAIFKRYGINKGIDFILSIDWQSIYQEEDEKKLIELWKEITK